MESEESIIKIFYTKRLLNYGYSVYILGSHPLLGNWDPHNSIELQNSHKDIWHKTISLPIGQSIEFKFAQSPSNKSNLKDFKYDEGDNQRIDVSVVKTEKMISVMSFNIRYENKIDKDNSWDFRKDLCCQIILENRPHLLGVQESKPSQTSFLIKNLEKNYGFYGRGRDYDDNDECVGIFYNKERFFPIDMGTFWLSENRHQPGSSLKNSYFPRITSWIKFFDDYQKEYLWYFNTHFDHESKANRKRNSEILLDEIEKICGFNGHTILTGDFNANKGEECLSIIEKKLKDTDSKGEYTFHGFYGVLVEFFIGKIDFIYIGKNFEAIDFTTIKTAGKNKKGKEYYPSDHYPVKARITYKL